MWVILFLLDLCFPLFRVDHYHVSHVRVLFLFKHTEKIASTWIEAVPCFIVSNILFGSWVSSSMSVLVHSLNYSTLNAEAYWQLCYSALVLLLVLNWALKLGVLQTFTCSKYSSASLGETKDIISLTDSMGCWYKVCYMRNSRLSRFSATSSN